MEKINEKLVKNNLNIEIDKLANIVKISDLELFESNSWALTQNGKKFLDKFLPLYFDVLLNDEKISDKISQIVIEGHTDSNSFHQAKIDKNLYKKISINGRSYSNPVLNKDGTENFAKSRRVEFKIIYNEPSFIENVLNK